MVVVDVGELSPTRRWVRRLVLGWADGRFEWRGDVWRGILCVESKEVVWLVCWGVELVVPRQGIPRYDGVGVVLVRLNSTSVLALHPMLEAYAET